MGISKYLKNIRDKVGNELILMPGVSALIFNERGQLLLQKRGDNQKWSLPGGAVDPGETPAKAIIREVFEETGLVVEPIKIVGVIGGAEFMRFEYPNGDVVEVVATLFKCRAIGGELNADEDETLSLEFFNLDSIPELFPHYPLEILTHNSDAAYLKDSLV